MTPERPPTHTEYGYRSAITKRMCLIDADARDDFVRAGYTILQREVSDWQPYQQETKA